MKSNKKITNIQKLAILLLFLIIMFVAGFGEKIYNIILNTGLNSFLQWIILYLFVVLLFGIVYLILKFIFKSKGAIGYFWTLFGFITWFYFIFGIGGYFKLDGYLISFIFLFLISIFIFYNLINLKNQLDSNKKMSVWTGTAVFHGVKHHSLIKIWFYNVLIVDLVLLIISLICLYVFLSQRFF